MQAGMRVIMIMLILWVSNCQLSDLMVKVEQIIGKGRENIWMQIQKDEPVWDMPPWLGSMFLSQYYFELKALNISGDLKWKTSFNVDFFKDKLIKSQEEDGSWNLVQDLNRLEGSLDATIFNYWYLKDVGMDESSQTMKKARKFVLDHGGIQNSQVMTRFKLAVFGQYQWHLLPYIPLFLFNDHSFWHYTYIKNYVAQWVYPHLLPLAYLRYHKSVFSVSVCLSQLRVSRSDYCEEVVREKHNKHKTNQTSQTQNPEEIINHMLEEAIKIKGPKGLYGAYTVSTMLIQISFKDYAIRYGQDNDFVAYFLKNSFSTLEMVEKVLLNKRVPYEGSLDDGRYWDTILAANALLQSGQDPSKVNPTIQHLVRTAVQASGGIPYGYEFEYAPDIDDTSVLLSIYGKMLKYYQQKEVTGSIQFYERQIKKSYQWIRSNQNQDGGFPAFNKDRNDNQYTLLKLIFKWTGIDRSAEIFDPSCPDITGHFLEAIADCSLTTPQHYQTINTAIHYLYSTRHDGMWIGRWGINYIYAMGAVLPSISKIGYNLKEGWVQDTIKKLQSVQHSDGGFGQNSQSYNENKFVNGVSTVSMTAWGLMALIEVGKVMDVEQSITRAVKYIINNFEQNGGRFYDRSVVGTGHRGVLNLQYPIYAYTFPLISLSRFRSYVNGNHKILANQNIMSSYHAFNQTLNDEL